MNLRMIVAAVAFLATLAGCRGPGASLVVYSRSGGLAVLDDTLDVRESGAMTLTQRRGDVKAGLATEEDRARLRSLFDSPEFGALPGEFRAKGFDLITHTIKAETSRGMKTIKTMDGAEQPPVLTQVLNELQKLIDKCN
jgi:hypothetical protein